MCIGILEVRELTFIVRRTLSWIYDQLHKTLNWSFDDVVSNDVKNKNVTGYFFIQQRIPPYFS